MRNKFLLFLISLLTLTLIAGCSVRLSKSYTFPSDLLAYSEGTGESYRLSGFAEELCVPDLDEDRDIDGIDGEAFALFDLSEGRVISLHNIYKRMYPASTTKILTAYLALKYSDLDEIVTVPDLSESSVSGSSIAGLKEGDLISMEDLLYALMVPSGNDAALAIACHISGSSKAFADLMNEEARLMGATHSHFVNPNGLPDEDHYTSVYDMYLIFNEALKNDDFKTIASTYTYDADVNIYPGSVNEPRTLSLVSGNAFLSGKFSFAEGKEIIAGKTGHTNAAGFCLVLAESDQDNNEYISIIFNADIYEELYASMRRLAEKAA